jgi:hypothetical protein
MTRQPIRGSGAEADQDEAGQDQHGSIRDLLD